MINIALSHGLFFLVGRRGDRPTREFFTHMEMSSLPLKGKRLPVDCQYCFNHLGLSWLDIRTPNLPLARRTLVIVHELSNCLQQDRFTFLMDSKNGR